MDKIVDRVEIGRPLGIAKAGRGRGDDLGMSAEQIEKARLRMHRVHAVQQQDRRTPSAIWPAAQHLQLDPVDRHAVAGAGLCDIRHAARLTPLSAHHAMKQPAGDMREADSRPSPGNPPESAPAR